MNFTPNKIHTTTSRWIWPTLVWSRTNRPPLMPYDGSWRLHTLVSLTVVVSLAH